MHQKNIWILLFISHNDLAKVYRPSYRQSISIVDPHAIEISIVSDSQQVFAQGSISEETHPHIPPMSKSPLCSDSKPIL